MCVAQASAAVNYYNHHLGDYDGATSHLSWDEDMAYTRLLRVYYRLERPIPADLKAACRLVRAASKLQRNAVEHVLREFFVPRDDGWHNKREDEEISAYRLRIDQSKNAAAMRWHSDGNAKAMRSHESGIANQPPTSITQPPVTNPQEANGGASEELYKKQLDPSSPKARAAAQNPAWLFNIDHARLYARQLGIHFAGKTHQELKDEINARLEAKPSIQQSPKFAQSQ